MIIKPFPRDLIIPLIIGIALLVYLIIRAVVIPVTHDEANTCLTFAVSPVWDILTYKDPIPNNHIVNTLLIKLFSRISGMKPFVVRLPNILGFILFYSFLVVWIRKLKNGMLFFYAALLAIITNPFLIDFFSLARGYALSIAFMTVSAFYSWRYLSAKNSRDHLKSVIWGAVAVYTNFTVLNFYVPLVLGLFIVDAMFYFRSDKKTFYGLFLQLFVVSFILGAVSIYPIYRMVSTDQFMYWGTNGFYTDTIYTLADSSMYGINYFNFSPHVLANFWIYLFVIMLIIAVWEFRRNNATQQNIAFLFFVMLIAGAVGFNMLQNLLIKTPWLTTRTALFFFPLLMFAFIFFIQHLRDHWKGGFRFAAIATIVIGMIHFSRSVNLDHCYEWSYDANTKEVIEAIEADRTTDTVSLDVYWLFYPSMNFHIRKSEHKPIQLRDFHYNVDSSSTSTYYYLGNGEFQQIQNNFVEIAKFDEGSRVLARRKIIE